MIKEVYGRELKVGSFVMDGLKRPIGEDCYGIVISEEQVFRMSGRNIYTTLVYLVEHPCEKEIEIYKKLVTKYNQGKIDREKRKKEQQIIQRERARNRRNLVYKPGDILENETKPDYKYVYMGKLLIEYGDTKEEGYGYLRVADRYENLFDELKSDASKTLFNSRWFNARYIRVVGYDDSELSKIMNNFELLKTKVMTYDKVVGSVVLGETYTGIFESRAYYGRKNGKLDYTISCIKE